MAPPKKSEKDAAKSNGHSSSDVDGEKNDWKFREPYKIHDKAGDESDGGKGFDVKYEGGCHCGRVEFQLSREKPLNAKFCHCSTCQVLHGAPFQWAAIFEKGDINFVKGHHDLSWYDSGSKSTEHKLPCKVKCEYCGTPIMDEGRNMILLFPTLIKFRSEEEKNNFAATCHMFYEKRIVDIKDGLPKWSGMSGKSDLIADSPADAIKKRKREVEEEEAEEAKKNGEDGGDGHSEGGIKKAKMELRSGPVGE